MVSSTDVDDKLLGRIEVSPDGCAVAEWECWCDHGDADGVIEPPQKVLKSMFQNVKIVVHFRRCDEENPMVAHRIAS